MTQIIDFTADGGLTWQRVANFTDVAGPFGTHIPLQAYDGVDTYVIMCGPTVTGNDGIFKSTNDGVSFVRTTGITGLDFANDHYLKCEYGLGRLWLAAEVDFGDGGQLFSSTDDGDTWSLAFDPSGQDLMSFAISATGIVIGNSTDVNTPGLFDADGDSLPAGLTSNFFGQGTGWSPMSQGAAAAGTWLFADANSFSPNRFFAAFYNFTTDEVRIIFSDDNGTTWKIARIGLLTEGFPMATHTGCNFMWDGTNYHFLVAGTTNYWFWSKDGAVWTEAPASRNPMLLNWLSDIPHRGVAAATKDA